MDINRANLDALFANYLTAWQDVLEDPDAEHELDFLVTPFPSNTASNFYAWLDKIPGFRKWVGDRVYNDVRGKKFEVVNEDFEDSIRLDANDLEDDQVGMYVPIIRMMARSWLDLKRSEIVRVLTNNAQTFTGSPLFSHDHRYGETAGEDELDNRNDTPLDQAAFEAAFTAAAEWKFSDNQLVRPRFTHLIVGEKNRATAWSIVKATFIGDGAGGTIANPNYGRCELVVWPELTGAAADHWFLVDASKPVKAVALQVRK